MSVIEGPDGIDWGAAECHYGDHLWRGGGICVRCYVQLRCACGQFVREDGLDDHVNVCPLTRDVEDWEHKSLPTQQALSESLRKAVETQGLRKEKP